MNDAVHAAAGKAAAMSESKASWTSARNQLSRHATGIPACILVCMYIIYIYTYIFGLAHGLSDAFLAGSPVAVVLFPTFPSLFSLAAVSEALQLQKSQDVKRLPSCWVVLPAKVKSLCILRQKWCHWKPWPQWLHQKEEAFLKGI